MFDDICIGAEPRMIPENSDILSYRAMHDVVRSSCDILAFQNLVDIEYKS